MANIKSQMKRNKTNEKARLRNKAVKSALRTHARRVREAVEAGDSDKAAAAMRTACRAYDIAATKGVIHANKAANHKSRLTQRVNEAFADA